MKYLKLFENFDNDKQKLDISKVLMHYKEVGNLNDVDLPKLNDNRLKWLFDQLILIIDNIKQYDIDSDDFLNEDNRGLKPNGDLATFDLGFGNYYNSFDNDPDIIEINNDENLLDQIKNKLNIKNSTYIASGFFGHAHDIGDNKILKITKDKTEAINSKKILGLNIPHIANIYDVKKFTKNNKEYFIIVLEKLKLDDKLTKDWEDLKELFNDHISNHYKKDIIDKIMIKSKLFGSFLKHCYDHGISSAFNKFKEFNEVYNVIDLNDVAEISNWIKGSVTNNNKGEDIPGYIKNYVNTILNNKS